MKAVIQCGGMGTRLRPFTSVLPKPLMPIGARPVLELLLKWLRRNGIENVYVTTGYLGHLIRSVCGDGSQWNIKIRYTQEMEPLGTIGPLSLIRDELDEPFLVLNGDVLTDLSLSRFVAAHKAHNDLVTIATASRITKMDFGVIDEVNDTVQVFREKPSLSHLVSMGIYCMDPGVMQFIPSGIPFGFDDLMLQMLQSGKPVHVFKHDGLWLDIGRVEDFQKAQATSWEEQSASIEVAAA
ncbi:MULTISPECIES: sugar phosphate nucleotidyltransferase [unclassified Mesorhizobium]|uniref:nucleotidyltransferase family protein n=1 Tax=unclassified Mesorhizobium TaxID=325217 RepID=UPI000F75C4BF|nr:MULTISPECIES: sugar phosphate nucleotidyltransferase [unclassified Mesorhizobium]AZO14672.1 nucleotidyltransferase [Mesorhizobium sp. M2A.F.Ca.ET.043.05.1.1]RUX32514.1 nucleotidyltransferase [Mesorhizobium sp. M2A.F.Ca.ET.042.01.1.1]RWD67624.1 MAG: nucleotidyltransferase [Mesorhizobium sp.]RWE78641.1 MAG: nucleotidyltransferase [Mesorhizobium sp.]TIR21953.1 MAG: nucleotidyltransferase [Mesorhizobium sp.]